MHERGALHGEPLPASVHMQRSECAERRAEEALRHCAALKVERDAALAEASEARGQLEAVGRSVEALCLGDGQAAAPTSAARHARPAASAAPSAGGAQAREAEPESRAAAAAEIVAEMAEKEARALAMLATERKRVAAAELRARLPDQTASRSVRRAHLTP